MSGEFVFPLFLIIIQLPADVCILFLTMHVSGEFGFPLVLITNYSADLCACVHVLFLTMLESDLIF